jgi:hypothetical protein
MRPNVELRGRTLTLDELVIQGDALVEGVDGTHTFVAANKVGREAVQRAVEAKHLDKDTILINWRDAGEGWPDTWLGFSFPVATDGPFAACVAVSGARVFHHSEEYGFVYLTPPNSDRGEH